jgi:hypothetical protein
MEHKNVVKISYLPSHSRTPSESKRSLCQRLIHYTCSPFLSVDGHTKFKMAAMTVKISTIKMSRKSFERMVDCGLEKQPKFVPLLLSL